MSTWQTLLLLGLTVLAAPWVHAAPPPTPTPLACPAEGQTLLLRGCLGETGQWVRILFGSPEHGVQLEVKVQNSPKAHHHYGLPAYPSNVTDSALALAWTGVGQDAKTMVPARVNYCIRPDIAFYPKPDFERALPGWMALPGADA
jgi:hypothetical protein